MSVLSLSRASGTLLVVSALIASILAAPAGAERPHRAPIDPAVRHGLLSANGRTSALVHVAAGSSLAEGIAAAEDAGLATGTSYDAIKVFVAYGAPADFSTLAQSETVEYIEANAPIELQTDTAHKATRGQNLLDGEVKLGEATIDGSGVGIAIVDSGVDGTHPDLSTRMGGNVKIVCTAPMAGATEATPFEECRGPKAAVPLPDTDTTSAGGHGTHVAGIVAGDGSFSGGKYHGAATGATLYGVSVGTFLTVENALDGLAWVLDNHDEVTPHIKVVNNSWGSVFADYCGTEEDPCDEGEGLLGPAEGRFHKATWKLQEALVEAGVTVVFAAGNAFGTGFRATTTAECINPTPGIICVANYFDDNNGTRDDGEINGSSSRGAWDDPETWPDLTAPGTAIVSTCRAYQPVCALLDESGGANENYATFTGTSMAAPTVSGIIAQLYQADPDLTPAEVENLLEDTAYKFAWGSEYGRFVDEMNTDNSSSFEKGHGLVDALAAVRVVLGLDPSPGPSAFPAEAPQVPVARDTGVALQWDFISITEQEFTATCNYERLATQSIDAHVFEVPEDLRGTPLRVRIGATNPISFYDVSASFYNSDCNRIGGLAQAGDEDGPVPANTRYIVVTPGIFAYVTEIFIEYYDATPPEPVATTLSLTVEGVGSKRAVSSTLTDTGGTGVTGRTIQFFADGASIGSGVTDDGGAATLSVPSRYRSAKTQFGSCFAGDSDFASSSAGSGATCG